MLQSLKRRVKSLEILANALIGGQRPRPSNFAGRLKNIAPIPQTKAVELLEQSDSTHEVILSENILVFLQDELQNLFSGLRLEVNNKAVVWYDGYGVYPLVLRIIREDGQKFILVFLYSGATSRDVHLGTMLFKAGSPGIVELHLKKFHSVEIGVTVFYEGSKLNYESPWQFAYFCMPGNYLWYPGVRGNNGKVWFRS